MIAAKCFDKLNVVVGRTETLSNHQPTTSRKNASILQRINGSVSPGLRNASQLHPNRMKITNAYAMAPRASLGL